MLFSGSPGRARRSARRSSGSTRVASEHRLASPSRAYTVFSSPIRETARTCPAARASRSGRLSSRASSTRPSTHRCLALRGAVSSTPLSVDQLAGTPGVIDSLDDLVVLGELGDEGGHLEHGVIARPGVDADVEVLVDRDDCGVGAFASDVDAEPDPLVLLEVCLARAG